MFKLSIALTVLLASLNGLNAMEEGDGFQKVQGIDVFATNSYYEKPVRMEIGIVYKDLPEPVYGSFIMQNAREIPKPCYTIFKTTNISEINFLCYDGSLPTDEKGQNKEATILAAKNFSLMNSHLLKSLRLQLFERKIVIKTAYNLPPLFLKEN